MVDLEELDYVLKLHERSFKLFRWVGRQVRAEHLDFSVVHQDLSTAAAAAEWIVRNLRSLPNDGRPADADISRFARLFASYLSTSFEPIRTTKLVSECGCYCNWCSSLANVRALKPRKLTKGARRDAEKLVELYLTELARSAGGMINSSEVSAFIASHPDLNRDLRRCAYSRELIRRSQFAAQGIGVYALWRDIAWTKGGPDRAFRLSVEMLAASQQRILERLLPRLG